MKKIGDLETKTGKYFIARTKGKNKKESALAAGYSEKVALHGTSNIEKSPNYQALVASYKSKLLDKISIEEIAEAHADNIRQDSDRGARNKAIEMAVAKIEPEKVQSDESDRVLIVLK